MYSPLKRLDEVNSERKFLASQERAEEFFLMQSDAIRSIKDTTWYKEIRMYRVREWEACVVRLWEIKSDNIADYKAVQAQINLARNFLDFLENISE